MGDNDEPRTWWFGRLPGAWLGVGMAVTTATSLAVTYSRVGPVSAVVGALVAVAAGFAARGVWDAYRPWVEWRCPYCDHVDGGFDRHALQRRAGFHASRTHGEGLA